ncbi:hypothetical protein K8B83_14695 [Shewanella inventionis]|uniref:hypothetical protein n=1 Tax=Shewanella inventionis TaxID=1738770 RepID=UPI001CBE5A32|nr:hypothetical protein [Shewanella inventionis]UAL42125.1 hypothetical protein K8B83_14695 [Shewanella inventionis]
MATVMAIALKSFYFVKEVKTKQSKPFEVEQHNFNELKALGMVELAPDDEAAALKAKADEEAAALKAKADEEAALKAKADSGKKSK